MKTSIAGIYLGVYPPWRRSSRLGVYNINKNVQTPEINPNRIITFTRGNNADFASVIFVLQGRKNICITGTKGSLNYGVLTATKIK